MGKYLIFALILHVSVEAYHGIIFETEKPAKFANQEGCYFFDFDRMLQVGVPFIPQDGATCEMFTCRENKQIVIQGCRTIIIPENCERISANLSQAYPDCCEKVRCTLPDKGVAWQP